jgi:hypothetical protein
VVESKKCLDGQKRSSALLVRVCCCLLCISNLPWASRPTPLKTFEQHLSAALWGLGRGLSPLLLRPRSCPHGELFRSPFPLTIFLSLLSQQSKDLSLPLPGPRSPPWQTTRFLPLSMFVIGSSESLPCSCSPVKDLSLSLSDTAPFRNHQPTRGSFLDSLLSCLYVTCSLWHPSPLFSKIWEFPQKMRGHGTVECKGCLVCEVCSSAAALNFPPFRSGSPRDPSSCRCCVPLCLPWHCTARAVQQYTEQYSFFVVCAHFCGDKVPI